MKEFEVTNVGIKEAADFMSKLSAPGVPISLADSVARKTPSSYADYGGPVPGMTKVIETSASNSLWILTANDVTQDSSWIEIPLAPATAPPEPAELDKKIDYYEVDTFLAADSREGSSLDSLEFDIEKDLGRVFAVQVLEQWDTDNDPKILYFYQIKAGLPANSPPEIVIHSLSQDPDYRFYFEMLGHTGRALSPQTAGIEIVRLTTAEYNALTNEEQMDDTKLFFLTD